MPFGTLINWWRNKQEILNLNQRNVSFILAENDRSLYPWVDNKRKTKERLAAVDLATPNLIATLSTHREVSRLESYLAEEKAFAIKPTQGSGGGGILIIAARTRKGYRKASGQILTPDEVAFHMHNILSGLYSLSGQEDEVIIESLIRSAEIIPNLPLCGVPDLRILLYRGVPVASMLRLPTFDSEGKANLHMGGIGVGIDIATGLTTSAIHQNRFIEHHPEFDMSLLGHHIPQWETVLSIAAQVYDAIPLNYMGVDIVIDQQQGPLILEGNARPGISIQLATRKGLLPALRRVQEATVPLDTVEARLAFACQQPQGVAEPYALPTA
jgi:alpha-L-glutamate ligase-like protein